MNEKETLHHYLRQRRADLLAKVDGLSEHDARRPLTPTGTNLLGLVKHVASVQLGYFGEVFGRPAGHPVATQITALDAADAAAAAVPPAGVGVGESAGIGAGAGAGAGIGAGAGVGAVPDGGASSGAFDDADMWVPADQSSEQVLDFYRFSAEHSDATIDALELDAVGEVPWWPPERRDVTLHQILVHLVAEVSRHAGHADILREQLDGSAGNGPADPNIPGRTDAEWQAYCSRIDAAARAAADLRA